MDENTLSAPLTTDATPPEDTLPAEDTLAAPAQSADTALPDRDGDGSAETPPTVDYAALAAADLAELQALIPSLHISHIGELPGAARYGELRDRGLTVEEAFRAACHTALPQRTSPYDNRSHLHSAVPRGAASSPAMMSASEMRAAKELFDDLSESEIQKLYAKCRS